MKTAFYIAKRYFFSKKKQNFINIISYISMIGVAVGTMALIIAMSFFNGLEEMTKTLYYAYNPDIKITIQKGKSFEIDSLMLLKIKRLTNVKTLTEVVEDNALLRYDDQYLAVNVKGVSRNFNQQYDLSAHLVTGNFAIWQKETPVALLGIGIQGMLSINIQNPLKALVFWYPKKQAASSLDPSKAFVQQSIWAGGVLSIEPQFDQSQVIVPLEFANELMSYGKRRTSLEVKVTDNQYLTEVQEKLKELLGEKFAVKNFDEQQENYLRAIKIERLFVFATFAIILMIASFNIFFFLTMLVIEKQKDIGTLIALGARRNLIRQVFLWEGTLLAFVGTFVGVSIGLIFSFLQQKFGLVGMGIEDAILSAYPAKVVWTDVILICILMFFITIGTSLIPAQNATKVIWQK